MHGSSTHSEQSATFTARGGLTIDASVLSAYADAAAAPGGAVTAFAFGSPPRKSIWKRNSKSSGGGHGGACYNVYNGGSAPPPPPVLTEDTRSSARGQPQNAADELDASDGDAASDAFDIRAFGESTEDGDRGAGGGGGGGDGGASVDRRNGDSHKRGRGRVIPSVAFLVPGCSDGGSRHTFEVRGQSFRADTGAEVHSVRTGACRFSMLEYQLETLFFLPGLVLFFLSSFRLSSVRRSALSESWTARSNVEPCVTGDGREQLRAELYVCTKAYDDDTIDNILVPILLNSDRGALADSAALSNER